uniref:protein-tyrosine-phosphatase n=1 Tax=Oreochromis aureus TaxID=47969 RepID=A0A668VJF0_OREAU
MGRGQRGKVVAGCGVHLKPSGVLPLFSFSPIPHSFFSLLFSLSLNQIGVSGGVASFVCQATGNPKPSVYWNKKGKKVNSQRIEVTIEFDDGAGAVLRIQPLRVQLDIYSSCFKCCTFHTLFFLLILSEDLLPFGFPSIDMGPQLKVVERTRTATMLCAASGIPDPEISWFKDFLPVDPSTSQGRIKQLRSGALQIENSEETDQGKYECVATNSQGVRYSSPANLYVRVPLAFSILPSNHEIMPGGSINITCVAVGSPMPYVKWMLGNEDLTPEDEMPIGRNVLELNGVRESANYTCVAMSSLGIIEASAQVLVKTLPKPPGTPIVTETTATSVTITWDSGNPDPVSYYIIQYRAKGPDSKYETVDSITTTRYSIGGLYPNTEYEIRVSAYNTIGQGPPSARVEARTGEQAPASPPRNVQAHIISENTVMVRWEEPEEPNGQVKGYRVYYTMDPSRPINEWQIHNVQDSVLTTIQNLVTSETYTIQVLAFTSVGDGPFSDPVHVKVLRGVPGQPGKFKVGKVTDTSIELTWEPSYNKEKIVNYELLYKPEKLTFGPRNSYTVEGLKANTEYSFSLAAISSKGIGAFTNELVQRTSQAKPSAAPEGVSCESASSTSLRVSWRPPPMEGQNGELASYELRYQRIERSEFAVFDGGILCFLPQELILGDLKAETLYSVSVAAYTTKGDGAHSKAKLVQTPGIGKHMSSIHFIVVRWAPPLECSDSRGAPVEIQGYRLQFGLKNSSLDTTVDFTNRERNFTARDLSPGSSYIFVLAAKSRAGYGDVVQQEITVPMFPPVGYPKISDFVNVTCCSLQLSWLPPTPEESNGVITEYTLAYKEAAHTQPSADPASESSYTILGLNHSKAYEVQLRAHNKAGPGPFSPLLVRLTLSLETGRAGLRPQEHLSKHWFNFTSPLTVDFTPKTLNLMKSGPVEYNRQKMEVDARLRKAVIPNLQPNTSYDFKITAPEGNPGGLRHRISAKTSPPITIRRPEIDRTRDSETTVTLILPSLENRSPINQRQRDSRQQKQVDLRRAYITARFTPAILPAFFTLGDQLDYGGFENRALEPGQEYVFFILAELNSTSGPFDAGDGLIWVVGPVLAVVFIICIVIAILLSKRKDSEPGTKSLLSNAEMMAHHPTDPVEMRRINFQTPGMMSHPPIPISELAEHIELLKANDNLRLSQEYESIDPSQQFTWEHSNLEVNKPKNRYANVIAYDHTRVILSPIEGILGSDYINANYIDGYRKQNAYIATQGPLPETFGDFWRMVWEQRAASVVMMTRLEEKSRIKCDQYWPSRGTETYGMIQATLLDTMELATFCVRTFSLHKSGSSERREVRQFQFTAWPDHGVPEYPTPFLNFLRRVKACNPPDAGPIIAHCSAGVGRTGCFIVIDAMLERIRHERTVDIYGHVTLMRSQRNYMVQTEDQYSFIHEALLEAVACGNTEVAARSLYSYMQKLSKVESGEHVIGMELEFKRLANTKAHTSRFVTANLPCNKFKNRLVNIMPYETTRVCLQPIRGLEGSDYINASYIDGYRQQRGYIATQGPLAETTEDFWRMLWEHNSTIVVMLTKLREMGREKCHQYWPAERSARYQYFVVDPMAEYNMPQYILREFKVTDARDGQSRTVRQFQFTDWPEQGVPKSGEGFIDFIGQVHKTKEQFGQDGPICVHCSAGVGRTGVFITLSIVLERMRYEGAVDIFQTVKMLRTQRPAMVQTEDEYQFCYQAALEYLGSFDHYAT